MEIGQQIRNSIPLNLSNLILWRERKNWIFACADFQVYFEMQMQLGLFEGRRISLKNT